MDEIEQESALFAHRRAGVADKTDAALLALIGRRADLVGLDRPIAGHLLDDLVGLELGHLERRASALPALQHAILTGLRGGLRSAGPGECQPEPDNSAADQLLHGFPSMEIVLTRFDG